MSRRNLVVVRAGDNSVHPGWLVDAERNFDIYVSYFGNQENRYADSADFHENRKGMKWPVLGELLQAQPELLERYAYFWFPDDDIVTDTATINRMFDFAAAYQLALAQPALTRNSYFSWPLLLQDPRYQLRYTRFVEVMVPVLDRAALRTCLPTFTENSSGWGLDFVWPLLLRSRGERAIAIIDATAVFHSRPVGGGELYKATGTSVAECDKTALLAKYGLSPDVLADTRYFTGGIQLREAGTWRHALQSLSRSLRRWNYRRLARRARA
ncbi:hypothetical protein [Thermomonas sp.]|uniref:hypothetical protein n=1 Tax=Thermomonas sp. TaxID=1971895 RepID=UPI0035B44484